MKEKRNENKFRERRSGSKDIPGLVHFEFRGAQHTVELLTSRSSTNVVMEVDGVMQRMHVTLCEGIEQEDWLDDAQLIEFAKETIGTRPVISSTPSTSGSKAK
jgi:hypothetical protein